MRHSNAVRAERDADLGADAALIRLGAPQVDDQTVQPLLDPGRAVAGGNFERGELGAAQRGGEPDEDERPITVASQRRRERFDRLAKVGRHQGRFLVGRPRSRWISCHVSLKAAEPVSITCPAAAWCSRMATKRLRRVETLSRPGPSMR